MHFQIEIEREDDGRWIADVPDLPGVIVYGPDRATAVAKAQALTLRVLTECLEHNETTEVIFSPREVAQHGTDAD